MPVFETEEGGTVQEERTGKRDEIYDWEIVRCNDEISKRRGRSCRFGNYSDYCSFDRPGFDFQISADLFGKQYFPDNYFAKRSGLMKKGSLTLYFSLLLLLLLSLFFTILESSRAACLRADAMRMSEAAAESAFAEYSRPLLEEYDLLMLDFGYGKESGTKENAEKRMNYYLYQNAAEEKGSNGRRVTMLNLTVRSANLEKYRLATDDQGDAFYDQVCEYMKEQVLLDAEKEVLSFLTSQAVPEDQTESQEEAWGEAETAESALSNPESYGDSPSIEFTEEELSKAEQITEEEKGLFSRVSEMKEGGILSLLLGEEGDISSASLPDGNLVTERSLEKGNIEESSGKGSRILFQCYIENKFTDFRSEEEENHALQYEKEYLYGGKQSDRENLEAVATSILAIRESVNFASLLADPQKREEARILALAITGVLALPGVFAAIEGGILLAWAFLDSISDLQKLFAGEKLSAFELGENSYGKMDYEQYLQILLMTRSKETLVGRCMNLIEQNIRKTEGYEGFQLDHCITEAEWNVSWEADAVFLSLFPAYGYSNHQYYFLAEGEFAYEIK